MMQSVGNTRVYYLQHHANNFFKDRQVCQLKGKEKATTDKANKFQGKNTAHATKFSSYHESSLEFSLFVKQVVNSTAVPGK